MQEGGKSSSMRDFEISETGLRPTEPNKLALFFPLQLNLYPTAKARVYQTYHRLNEIPIPFS